MRHTTNRIALIAAVLMIMAVPVMAFEAAGNQAMEPSAQNEKNECLLVAMNCPNQVDSIQQNIDRIQNEINRGSDVYTNDELNKLEQKLEDTRRNFEVLTSGA